MTSAAPEDASLGEETVHRVAKEFTRLYYRVLNDNPDYLHQFYGQGSCVTVSETQDDGVNYTVCADTLEQIKALTLRMFEEVRVTLTNCTPQNSLGGSIQLMVSGVMHQKNCDEERLFTQAMLLAKQEQGYYVLNDTVHVHSRTSSWKVLKFREVQENAETQQQQQQETVPDAKGTVIESTEAEPLKDEKDDMEEDEANVAGPAQAPAQVIFGRFGEAMHVVCGTGDSDGDRCSCGGGASRGGT